jgi:hypothetical protein
MRVIFAAIFLVFAASHSAPPAQSRHARSIW